MDIKIPTGLPNNLPRIDPEKMAGRTINANGTTIRFKPNRVVEIFRPFGQTAQHQQHNLGLFRKFARNDLPDVCGNCQYCQLRDYKPGVIPTCTHPNAPDRNGQPLFVQPTFEAPPVCPLRSAWLRKQIKVFTMWATGKAPTLDR